MNRTTIIVVSGYNCCSHFNYGHNGFRCFNSKVSARTAMAIMATMAVMTSMTVIAPMALMARLTVTAMVTFIAILIVYGKNN